MRSTVGPLPSAVYWRRRAVVLGALLLGALILFVSCSGNDNETKRRDAGSIRPGGTVDPSTGTTPQPSFEDAGPGRGPVLPNPSDATASPAPGLPQGQQQGVSAAPDVNVAAGINDQCADAEMTVKPVPAFATVRRGKPVEIQLKIKNISVRTCTRDVGADLQEIYIKQGARRVWSSDACRTVRGSTMGRFPGGFEREFRVTWNGLQSTKCAGTVSGGPAPTPGEYEVYGRLGGKVTGPVKLILTP